VIFQEIAFDCPNLTSVWARYRVVLAHWPVFFANNFICSSEVAVHTDEISFGTLISNMGGQLVFLDVLITTLCALNIDILAVTCAHVQVGNNLSKHSPPLAATNFHHTMNLKNQYLLVSFLVQHEIEGNFSTTGTRLAIFKYWTDTAMTEVFSTAADQVGLPSYTPAELTVEILWYRVNELTCVMYTRTMWLNVSALMTQCQ